MIPSGCSAMDGLVLPGVGAFPAGMAAIRAAGLDELLQERVEAGVPLMGLCLGMQLLFERSEEHDGAEGLGLLAGTVRRLNAPGLKLPHIGWSELRWLRATPLSEGLPDPAYLYHVHSFAVRRPIEEVVLASADYGEPFAAIVGSGQRVRHAVAPGEVLRARVGVAWELHTVVRPRGGRRREPVPGDRHPRWQRGAAGEGDFDAEEGLRQDPLAAARGWTEAGARYLHVVDLDGAKSGAPENLENLRRIADELGVPVQYGGGLRSATGRQRRA